MVKYSKLDIKEFRIGCTVKIIGDTLGSGKLIGKEGVLTEINLKSSLGQKNWLGYTVRLEDGDELCFEKEELRVI